MIQLSGIVGGCRNNPSCFLKLLIGGTFGGDRMSIYVHDIRYMWYTPSPGGSGYLIRTPRYAKQS
jgi:hypothetical protein